MSKLTLRVVYEEQSGSDTLKMFLWGDQFLARVVREGAVTDETVILRITSVDRREGSRQVFLRTNYGLFDCIWPHLEKID